MIHSATTSMMTAINSFLPKRDNGLSKYISTPMIERFIFRNEKKTKEVMFYREDLKELDINHDTGELDYKGIKWKLHKVTYS